MSRSFEWLKRRYELFVEYIGKELKKLKITLDVKVSLLVYKDTFSRSTKKLGVRAEVFLRVLGVLLRSVGKPEVVSINDSNA
jgi:hypothetical protein